MSERVIETMVLFFTGSKKPAGSGDAPPPDNSDKAKQFVSSSLHFVLSSPPIITITIGFVVNLYIIGMFLQDLQSVFQFGGEGQRSVHPSCKHVNDKLAASDVECISCKGTIHFEILHEACRAESSRNLKLKKKPKSNAALALFTRYDELMRNHAIEKDAHFIWCSHGCGSGQINEGGEDNPIVRCIKCKKLTCFVHNVKFHNGESCAEYSERMRKNETAASESTIQAISRPCPNCRANIEKNGGCDHMTCRACKFEFCYRCGADFNKIRQEGNQQHLPSCTYYM